MTISLKELLPCVKTYKQKLSGKINMTSLQCQKDIKNLEFLT